MGVYEVYNAKGIGELTVYVIKSGKIASYRKWRWWLKLNVDKESNLNLLDPFRTVNASVWLCLRVDALKRPGEAQT